jgi:hypothetical protein
MDPPLIHVARGSIRCLPAFERARVLVLGDNAAQCYKYARSDMLRCYVAMEAAYAAYRAEASEANAVALQTTVRMYEHHKMMRDKHKASVIQLPAFEELLQFYDGKIDDAMESL